MRNCDQCGGKKWYALIDSKTGLQKTTADGRLQYRCFRNPKHIQAEEYPFPPQTERAKPNVLYFDLEISKSLYYTYGRRVPGEYLRSADLVHEYFVICWAASYVDGSKVFSACVTSEQAKSWTDAEVLAPLHDLMSAAEVVAGHNVNAFDLKKINTRFISNGWQPITGRDGKKKKTVDTLTIARSKFAFESNALDDLCKRFGIKGKDKITDDDWREILKTGDQKTLDKIHKYCRGDVRNGKALYKILSPFAGNKTDWGALLATKEGLLK